MSVPRERDGTATPLESCDATTPHADVTPAGLSPSAVPPHVPVARDPEPAAHVRIAADHAEVTLAGELDLATAPAITQAVRNLLAAGHQHVIVNIDAVAFMDARTIGVLVAAHRDVTTSGRSLQLTAHPLCARLLEMTRTTEVFGRPLSRQSNG